MYPFVSLFGLFSSISTAWVSITAEPHNGYVTERVGSSAAWCQVLAQGKWKIWVSSKNKRFH